MIVRYIALGAALLVAACQQPQAVTDDATANTDDAAINSAASEAPTSAPGYPDTATLADRLAKCSSTFTAMERFFKVLAESETGEKRADLESRAQARDTAAAVIRTEAYDTGAKVGKTPAAIDAIITKADAQYARGVRDAKDLSAFAATVLEEENACKVLVKTGK